MNEGYMFGIDPASESASVEAVYVYGNGQVMLLSEFIERRGVDDPAVERLMSADYKGAEAIANGEYVLLDDLASLLHWTDEALDFFKPKG